MNRFKKYVTNTIVAVHPFKKILQSTIVKQCELIIKLSIDFRIN